ncbi:MAG: type I methionyl aminopeptidase [bacterium]|nr:type I methionyl aminopeptidase [bacterium]
MSTNLITGNKTPEQMQALRQSGRRLAEVLAAVRGFVRPGVSELDIDAFAAREIAARGAVATYKTDEVKFPNVICISTNDEVVHGIPTDYVLEQGDVVSFDLVIAYEGMKTDAAFTMVVGEKPSGVKKHLINVTERSLYAAIDAIHGPVMTGDIGAAVEKVLTAGKLGVIRELVGHGVGLEMHMPPEVPNYGKKGSGVLLQPGEVIAIEPMATLGGERVRQLSDGWTISTRDSSLSAHFEHTILITETGAEILTKV